MRNADMTEPLVRCLLKTFPQEVGCAARLYFFSPLSLPAERSEG
jgi:hypothetical protein